MSTLLKLVFIRSARTFVIVSYTGLQTIHQYVFRMSRFLLFVPTVEDVATVFPLTGISIVV